MALLRVRSSPDQGLESSNRRRYCSQIAHIEDFVHLTRAVLKIRHYYVIVTSLLRHFFDTICESREFVPPGHADNQRGASCWEVGRA